MIRLAQFFRRQKLPPELERRLDEWQRLAAPSPADIPRRWVVVDTETSGLSTGRDKLIAIGAVAVEGRAILVEPSFEAVLRQETVSSRDNIELHGVGASAQEGGEDPASALVRFLEFARKDPLAAYHAEFDATFLRRAIKASLGIRFGGEWLDLATLVPRKFPVLARELHGLDPWLARFGIEVGDRHNALADAFATAQLFLIADGRARRDGKNRLADLLAIAGEHASGMARLGR